MDTPCDLLTMKSANERLRLARLKHFPSARAAAIRHNWVVSTYASHENGQTPVPTDAARDYARAFKVSAAWILTGEETKRERGKTSITIVGKVGAGAQVIIEDDHGKGSGIGEIDLPTVDDNLMCVKVEGDSQRPRYFHGELVFYKADHFAPSQVVGQECVVRLQDGRMLIKTVRRGTRKGVYSLESWNADLIEDVVIDWAAPVAWRGS